MKKVLLIKFSSLGDILAFTPVIPHIHNNGIFEIHHWVLENYKDVTLNNPYIYKQFTFKYQKKRFFLNLIRIFINIYHIRKNNYEYIFLFHRSNFLKILSLFINSRYKFGFKTNYFFDFIFNSNLVFNIYKNRTIQYVDLVNLSGFKNSSQIKINYFPTISSSSLHPPFSEYIVINPGGGNLISDAKNRIWPVENYIQLIRMLEFNVVLVGSGESDIRIANHIELNINKLKVANFVNKSDLNQVSILISKSLLFIGNDSGLIFLSAALGVKSVGIYGPTPIISAVPYGNLTVPICSNYHCSPCYNPLDGLKGKMYLCKQNICMQTISVSKVYEAIIYQLKGKNGL